MLDATTVPSPNASFTNLSKLPIEIRALIWKATLKPRVVAIDYNDKRGFYTCVTAPIVVDVCKGSRDAVIGSLPSCFGSIFYPAEIRSNVLLDILYLGLGVRKQIAHFFSTFGDQEISGLQSLALDNKCIISRYSAHGIGDELRAVVRKLPSLKELLIIYGIEDMTGLDVGARLSNRCNYMRSYRKISKFLLRTRKNFRMTPETTLKDA